MKISITEDMIDKYFNFDIQESDLYNIVYNPSSFKWSLWFHFYGTRKAELAHGYGGTLTNARLYKELNDPFLENYFTKIYPHTDWLKNEGDAFINKVSEELFPEIEHVGFTEKEANDIKVRLPAEEKRFTNARDRYYEVEDRIGYLIEEMKEVEAQGKKRKDGELNRTTKAYQRYRILLDEIYSLEYEKEKAEKAMNREHKRYTSVQGRYDNAVRTAYNILHNTRNLFSEKIKERGRKLAKDVRDDIIRKVTNGVLPLAYPGFSQRTVRERTKRNLLPLRKYFASGQLLHGLVVDFKLEKR